MADYRRLLGDTVAFPCWTDPGALSEFDLVLPLIAWGYQRDCPAWFALLDRMDAERWNVANPANILRWNSDKAYLVELERAGVAIVPTLICETLCDTDLYAAREHFGTNRLVVKPPISGGADGTFLLGRSDTLTEEMTGLRMLIQPFLPAIANEGELSLFYFAGHYSHAISKHPADGDFRVQEQFGGVERAVEAPVGARALAEAALSTSQRLNESTPPTYARVDMLRDEAGQYRLMELELIEPSLFLRFSPDGGALFASAVQSQFAL
jgi:hypothetical protein